MPTRKIISRTQKMQPATSQPECACVCVCVCVCIRRVCVCACTHMCLFAVLGAEGGGQEGHR